LCKGHQFANGLFLIFKNALSYPFPPQHFDASSFCQKSSPSQAMFPPLPIYLRCLFGPPLPARSVFFCPHPQTQWLPMHFPRSPRKLTRSVRAFDAAVQADLSDITGKPSRKPAYGDFAADFPRSSSPFCTEVRLSYQSTVSTFSSPFYSPAGKGLSPLEGFSEGTFLVVRPFSSPTPRRF